jgi:hypothetical protein
MIKADILFIKNDKFYEQINKNKEGVTGYELFFQLVNDFKNNFNFVIHTLGESSSEKCLYFNFKSDYIIYLKEYSNARYIELYSHNNSMEDFTTKFNYLKELVNEL